MTGRAAIHAYGCGKTSITPHPYLMMETKKPTPTATRIGMMNIETWSVMGACEI